MVHLSQKGRPRPLSEMERKGAVRRACGSWEWQGSQGSHEQGEVLIGLAGKAERNLDGGTSYSQAATSPSTNGERKPPLQTKATCSLGSHFCLHLLQVLALGFQTGQDMRYGWELQTDCGPGKPALQPGSLLQKETSGRVWARQLSETEK